VITSTDYVANVVGLSLSAVHRIETLVE